VCKPPLAPPCPPPRSNMILTMVGEPLVIAIKLADRLHNMRTV
jgi:(p)ppGpp synthase/HD superfamily hydrolase